MEGSPAVSPTLHRDSGAQLAYPAPDDPLVRRDIAMTTGFFSGVAVIRPEAYRFHGAPGGPATHVFTIDLAECYGVQHSGVWQFEGVAIAAIVEAMTRQGWVDEGSVMCVER